MKRLLLIGAVVALAAVGMAQGGGQGRGGMRMRFGGNELSLALRDDVAKEIALTGEQRTKLEDLMEKAREERSQFRMGGQGGPPDEKQRQEMRQRIEAAMAKQRQEMAAILNADQMKRLKELRIQRGGIMSVMDPEIQKDLGMDASQTAKIKDLMDKQQAAMRAVFEKVQNQEIDRSEVGAIMEKNRKIMEDELAKVLTADQKTKFEAMKGKAFTFEEDEDGPGGL